MRRNEIILLVIIATTAIVAVIPTPHVRTRENLVETLDCSTTLGDGGSIVEAWSDMQDQTKIVIDIHSSEDINVRLSAVTSMTQYQAVLLYDLVKTVHSVTFIRNDPAYEVTVWNPSVWGWSPSATVSGNIQAYHVYEETEWLPWWLP